MPTFRIGSSSSSSSSQSDPFAYDGPAGLGLSTTLPLLTTLPASPKTPPIALSPTPLEARGIDLDPARIRSRKDVIVVGDPSKVMDSVAEGLKDLGFKVYDFKALSDRHERDSAMWIESIALDGTPDEYTKADFDKLIEDHNALVGLPITAFTSRFTRLYAGAKFIFITEQYDSATYQAIMQQFGRFMAHSVDLKAPIPSNNFFWCIAESLVASSNDSMSIADLRREVREDNLLEISEFHDWNTICDFLGKPCPNKPVPSVIESVIVTELHQHNVLENHETPMYHLHPEIVSILTSTTFQLMVMSAYIAYHLFLYAGLILSITENLGMLWVLMSQFCQLIFFGLATVPIYLVITFLLALKDLRTRATLSEGSDHLLDVPDHSETESTRSYPSVFEHTSDSESAQDDSPTLLASSSSESIHEHSISLLTSSNNVAAPDDKSNLLDLPNSKRTQDAQMTHISTLSTTTAAQSTPVSVSIRRLRSSYPA